MLFELPLTTAEEIVAEFRPDGRTATKGALRTLRARRAVSGGISEPVREPSGQVRGSLHLYCALNLDAARLARLGRDAEAQQIAAVAEDIERRDETAHVALALAEARAEVDDHWSPRRVF